MPLAIIRLDRRDEVWTGVLHMVPGPGEAHMRVQQQLAELLGPLSRASGLIATPGVNLGSSDDYRVPDAAALRELGWGTYASTAALVVETLSQGDETFDKLPFYAEHQVDEVLVVDPQQRTIQWLGLADGVYRPVEQSGVIDLSCAQLAQRIDWPATGTAAQRDA